MDERSIVAALIHSREAYNRLRGRLDKNDFSEQGRLIVNAIIGFYGADPDAERVDEEVLRSVARRSLLNAKHADAVIAYLDALPAPCSPANIANEYRALRRYRAGLALAEELAQGHHGDKVDALIEKYRQLGCESDEQSERPDADSLYAAVATGNRIRLHPAALNRRLRGGLMRGEHAVIFGRPNAGKTLLAINIAGGCALDGHRVLYCVNEEPREKYATRLLARVSGIPTYAMEESPAAIKLAEERAGDAWRRIVLVDLLANRTAEIEALCDRYQPDVVVVDQIRNIKIPGAGNRTLELDEAAREVRQIGRRKHAAMISLTQAGDSAEGRLELRMGDVDFSNTAIQGACDLLVGIGVDAEALAGGRRMLSPCKNKIGHDQRPFLVFVEPELSLVLSRPRTK